MITRVNRLNGLNKPSNSELLRDNVKLTGELMQTRQELLKLREALKRFGLQSAVCDSCSGHFLASNDGARLCRECFDEIVA